jgi:hypothetical protein
MADDTIDARLARLEALIDTMTTVSPRQASADAGPPLPAAATELDPAVLDHLASVSDRLRELTAEIAGRQAVREWDGADHVTARLLVEHLTAATRDCRVVVAAAVARLQRAEFTIQEFERELDRERQRAPGAPA